MIKRQTIILGIILLGFLLIAEVACAHETNSVQPSSVTSEGNYYQQLYRTDFDSRYDWLQSVWNPQHIWNQNGQLHITGDQLFFPGYWVQSRKIDYEVNDFLYDGYVYNVIFEFTPTTMNQNTFRIFYNGEIDIVINGQGPVFNVIVYQYHEYYVEEVILDQFFLLTPHIFDIKAWHQPLKNKYQVSIDGNPKGLLNYNPLPAEQYVKFGDFDLNSNGGGKWNFFEFFGLSTAQYFNNLNDDNNHEFSKIHAEMTPDVYISANGGSLSIYSADLIGPQFNYYNAYINTEFINYDPAETWRISLDFKFHAGLPTPFNFILVSNKQVTLKLDTNLNGVGLYWFDGQSTEIMLLQPDLWYFLEVEKTPGNKYRVLINRGEVANGCNFDSLNPNDWLNYLEMGVKANGECPEIRIDDIKLIVENRGHVDSDNDGLGDDFEDGDEPYIYIWSTDFEDILYWDYRNLTLEETGWDRDPPVDDPNTQSEWSKGLITMSPWDPMLGHAGGISDKGKVLGTSVGGPYQANVNDNGISTPIISLDNVEDAVKITLWHWYDTEQGVNGDGGNIMFSTDGGQTYSLLGSYLNPYNTQQVTVLGGSPGFTGISTDWEYLEFVLGSSYVGPGKSLRLKFVFSSDDDANVGGGWYIDDIKIFGNTNPNLNDVDGDSLDDGIEFSKFCSSPFISDTDGDSISDFDEVTKDILADYSYRSDVYDFWSDPLIKDVWVEIDEISTLPGGQWWSTDIQILIQSEFKKHCIFVHFEKSEVINWGDGDITWAEVKNQGKLKQNGGYRENAHDGYYHYLLWAVQYKNDDDLLGESYASHWLLAVFAGNAKFDTDAKRAKTTMHELGHNLGLWHYDDNYVDENSNNAPDSSMVKGVASHIGYLGKESDWTYTMGGNSYILGGWQYSHTDLNTYKRGLDYSGILKDPIYQDTGWSYPSG